jgi:hypothetical protein
MTTFATIAFLLLWLFGSFGSTYVSMMLLVAGAAICGPDSLLAGSVSVTIGEKYGKVRKIYYVKFSALRFTRSLDRNFVI